MLSTRWIQASCLALALLVPAAGLSGCKEDPPPAAAATHVCPMHPDQQGVAGDRCSECGMDFVPKEQAAKQGQ